MKKLEVSKLHRGDAFTVAGQEYVALDHIGGGVLAVQRNTLADCMPFGKINDWRKSRIREYLNGEYLDRLVKNGIVADRNILTMNIDLKETNGGREYGFDSCKVGVLTLSQYFQYNEHLPLTDEWWWTATPWGTPKSRSPRANSSTLAWFVNTVGNGGAGGASSPNVGVRPALIFNSSLLVEVEIGDGADDPVKRIVGEFVDKLRDVL